MKPATTDERGGWTSASSAEADSLCQGRHLAQVGIAEGEKSADADSGTRIHAALESGNHSTLSADELDTAEKCIELTQKVSLRCFGFDASPKIIREQRIWTSFANNIQHSGKPDLVCIVGEVALVIDYKTGRNEATASPSNLQLRDLAVLVASNYGVKTVHVAIVQPWATMTPEVCTYTLDDILAASDALEKRVLASNNPNAQRTPGDVQCRYCKAKATCGEFMAASFPKSHIEMSPKNIEQGIGSLTSLSLGKFLSLVRLAEETATVEVRRRIEAGETVEGWTIKPGREAEKITDAQTVFSRALAAGITQDEFVRDCITVGKTALKSALKTATALKGKALDAELDALLAGATETKTSSPILTKL